MRNRSVQNLDQILRAAMFLEKTACQSWFGRHGSEELRYLRIFKRPSVYQSASCAGAERISKRCLAITRVTPCKSSSFRSTFATGQGLVPNQAGTQPGTCSSRVESDGLLSSFPETETVAMTWSLFMEQPTSGIWLGDGVSRDLWIESHDPCPAGLGGDLLKRRERPSFSPQESCPRLQLYPSCQIPRAADRWLLAAGCSS